MYYAVEMCGNEYSLNGTIGRDVRTRKFRHLHLRHFVSLLHHYHSIENSRTLHLNFQDFPVPNPFSRIWKLYPKKSRTFQDFPGAWEPCNHVLHQLLPPEKNIHYNLRQRSPSLTLPSEENNLIRKNFLHRMLFRDIY